jgi:hypothetical protein
MKSTLLWIILCINAWCCVYGQLPQIITVKTGSNTYTGYQILCDLSKDEITAKLLTHYQQYKIRPFVHENTILAENIIYPVVETDKKITVQYFIIPDGNANAVQMVLWFNKVNITPQNYPETAEKAKQTLPIIFEGHLLKQNTVFNTPISENSNIEQRLTNIETMLKNIEIKLNLNENPNQIPVTSFEDALKLKMRSEQISVKEKELLKREAEIEDVDFALQAKQKVLQEKETELKKLADSIQKQIKHMEKLAKELNLPIYRDTVQKAENQKPISKEIKKTEDSTKKMPRGYVVPKKDTVQKENINTPVKNTIRFKGTPVKYNPVPYSELTSEQIDTLKYLRQKYIQEQYLKMGQKSLPCFTFELDMQPQECMDIITAYMAGLNCTEYQQKEQYLKYQMLNGIPLLKITQPVECMFYITPINDENSKVHLYFEVQKQALTRQNNPKYAFETERLILNIMGKL